MVESNLFVHRGEYTIITETIQAKYEWTYNYLQEIIGVTYTAQGGRLQVSSYSAYQLLRRHVAT